MKLLKFVLIIFLFLLPIHAHGFLPESDSPMFGNIIYPLTSINVKLKQAEIMMEGSEATEDLLTTANFQIINLENKPVSFKVAFPIESNCENCTEPAVDFKVFADGIDIPYKKGVHEGTPNFMWDISLKPNQRMIITCKYTVKWLEDPRELYARYVLSPLRWKGSPDKIKVELSIPKRLLQRGSIEVKPKQNCTIEGNRIEWLFKDVEVSNIDGISISFFPGSAYGKISCK